MERKHLPADLPTDDGGYALVCTVGRCRWNRKERAQGREGGREGRRAFLLSGTEGRRDRSFLILTFPWHIPPAAVRGPSNRPYARYEPM